MNVILLSGGSGIRLWPLSNNVRSKQFIKLFRLQDGTYESMLQRFYRNMSMCCSPSSITIATSKSQAAAIINQIGNEVALSVEPCRRDTFPAIALATMYLYEREGVSLDDAVVVCPVDSYVDKDFYGFIQRMYELASAPDASNLTLMGIVPSHPSDKYGYIIPENGNNISSVRVFKEKPDVKTAESYIEQGALWNSGVFAYKLRYVMDKAKELLGIKDYNDLIEHYGDIKKISFDYAVVESETDISVLRFEGRWDDVGSWDALSSILGDDIIGEGFMPEGCENTYIINELDIPVMALGIKNAIISTSSQGILVTDIEHSSRIKPYVEELDQRVMFAEKPWGSFYILDVGERSLTIKVLIKAGNHMRYHSHEYRDEVWVVCSGEGRVIVDGMEQHVSSGDVVTMKAGCRHIVFAVTTLTMIEVQIGDDIRIDDKTVYDGSAYE